MLRVNARFGKLADWKKVKAGDVFDDVFRVLVIWSKGTLSTEMLDERPADETFRLLDSLIDRAEHSAAETRAQSSSARRGRR